VEPGVAVSGHAHRTPRTTALRHVAGYVVVNHLHAVAQSAEPTGSRSTPPTRLARSVLLIGPTLVTPDTVPTGGRGLTLTATLGGRLVQKASTSELHFDVAALIAHASTLTVLQPGDLITTGTSGGTLDGPLEPGRNLHVAIKGLGDIDTDFTAAHALEADPGQTIQEMLGHSWNTSTVDTYTSLPPEAHSGCDPARTVRPHHLRDHRS
jgi:acylpyruvate hydrolase